MPAGNKMSLADFFDQPGQPTNVVKHLVRWIVTAKFLLSRKKSLWYNSLCLKQRTLITQINVNEPNLQILRFHHRPICGGAAN